MCTPTVKREEAEIDVVRYTQSASAAAKNRLLVKKSGRLKLLAVEDSTCGEQGRCLQFDSPQKRKASIAKSLRQGLTASACHGDRFR